MWLGDMVAGRWRGGTRVGLLTHAAVIVLISVTAGFVWSRFFGGLTWRFWTVLWLAMFVGNDLRAASQRRRLRRDLRDRYGQVDDREDRGRGGGGL